MKDLVIGSKYYTRDGRIATVVEKVTLKTGQTQPYKVTVAGDPKSKRYSPDGSWAKDGTRHPLDLVSLAAAIVSPPVNTRVAPMLAPVPVITNEYKSAAPAAYIPPTPHPQKKSMLNKLFSTNLVGPVDKNKYAMSMFGTVAIRDSNGTWITRHEGRLKDVDSLTIDGVADKFLYRLPATSVAKDDLIVKPDGSAYYVLDVHEDGRVTGLNTNDNTESIIHPVENALFPGMRFHVKITSLLNASGMGGNPMLLMLLSGDNDGGGLFGSSKSGGDSIGELMKMSLIFGGGLFGGNASTGANANPLGNLASNPMMALALLGDKSGGGDSMTKMLLLSSLGNSGFNFGFGQQPPTAAK